MNTIKKLKQYITKLLALWRTNHLLTCLAEECGEVMELLYLEPENTKNIEYELNDLLSVANLLHKENILNSKLIQISTLIVHKDQDNNSYKNIYVCIKNIQYFTHKAIRFTLFDIKPNSKKRNIDEIKLLLEKLVVLIQADSKLNIWNINELKPKQEKVLTYLKIAEEKRDAV